MITKVKRKRLPASLKPSGTLEEFNERLEKEGYRRIGSGLFATAWAKDDTHVIKVASNDSAYEDYLSVVMAHQENPYFPRVFDVKRFKGVGFYRKDGGDMNVTVVSMERLQPGEMEPKMALEGHIKLSAKHVIWDDKALELTKKYPMPNSKHSKQLFRVMKEMNREHGWLDLHSGNIMFRGEQPVIIDPVT